MVEQQICKWALLMQIWAGKLFWNREECLAGFPAEERKSSFCRTTSNPLESMWISGAPSSKLFNISLPTLSSQNKCWSKNWPGWCMAPHSPTCISCADLSSQMPCGMELPPGWGGPFISLVWLGACGSPCWQRAYLCFRQTFMAHKYLLPERDPFSTGITEDLTMNLYLQPRYIENGIVK